MQTLEHREKIRVKQFLIACRAYQFWPVQRGFGAATLDCLACINGEFWGIETKAPGAKLTKRQEIVSREISDHGGYIAYGTAEQIIKTISDHLSA
jgi:hypothetical protein